MATRTGRWQTRSGEKMKLAEHLKELRKRLFISAIAILVSAAVGYFIAPLVTASLRVPIDNIAESRNATMMYTTVAGAFDLRMQIAVTVGIVLSSPVWLFQIFGFLVPGLTMRERRYTLGFGLTAIPLFFLGAACGWLIFPHMVELLTSFSAPEEGTFLDARIYYDFVLKLVLAVGVAFVLPIFLVLLNFIGALSARTIIKGWRVALLVICVFTALATPAADVVSMFLLAIPMVILYFGAFFVAFLHDRRLARSTADADSAVLTS